MLTTNEIREKLAKANLFTHSRAQAGICAAFVLKNQHVFTEQEMDALAESHAENAMWFIADMLYTLQKLPTFDLQAAIDTYLHDNHPQA